MRRLPGRLTWFHQMTTGHLQASLDEISSKLAAKRAAKELKEREKQLKAGPAKVAKPVPVATPTKPEGISLSKRVRTPQRPDVADDGAPVKQPKVNPFWVSICMYLTPPVLDFCSCSARWGWNQESSCCTIRSGGACISYDSSANSSAS